MGFEEYVKSLGLDPANITPQQKATLQASYNAMHSSDGTGTGEDDPDAEELRIEQIRTICGDQHSSIQASAIKEGWSVNKTKVAVLRASRASVPTVRKDSRNAETVAQAISASLCFSAGLPEDKIGEWHGEQAADMATSKEFRGASISDVLFHTIQAAGLHARPGRIDSDTIRTAFRADQMIQAAGYSTIGGLSMLDNVMHKSLLNQYESVPSIIPLIAREREVPDLRKVNSYRITGMGRLQRLGKNGEIEHAWLKDQQFENKADLYAIMIVLSEEDMRNDDLGGFLQVPDALGRMAAQTREDTFWDLFLDPPAGFFSAGNGNYIVGADTALSIDALTTAEQRFDELVDADNKPLRLQPRSLLVAPANKVNAQSLMKETRVVGPTGGKNLADNPHVGKWTPLSEAALKGEAKKWYLVADPAQTAPLEVAYLRGRRQPTIERGDLNFNQLGAAWRCIWGLGAAWMDHRAIVKALGEAE